MFVNDRHLYYVLQGFQYKTDDNNTDLESLWTTMSSIYYISQR